MVRFFPHKRYYQTATHWTSTPDRFGGYTFSAPLVFQCRWEDKVDEFTDSLGRQSFARAFVYTEKDFLIDDFLYLGSSAVADPTSIAPPDNEKIGRIRRRDVIPSVDGRKFLKKYYLV